MSKKASEVSRRDFIRGGALAGVGLASLGIMASCAPQGKSSEESKPQTVSASDVTWDKEVDTLVVGSGTAAWGALAAKDAGDESVLIIEKSNHFGGTTSYSEQHFGFPVTMLKNATALRTTKKTPLNI